MPALTQTTKNPAPQIKRIITVSRELSPVELQELNRIYDGQIGNQIQIVPLTGDYGHREQELAETLSAEAGKAPERTAFCIPSNHLNHAGTAVVATACAILGSPCITLQHEADRLDTVEILYNKQRYIHSVTMTMAA